MYVKCKQPGKQRKAQFNAPLHGKRKRIRARLRTDDPELAAIRTVTVRVGDEVEVLRAILEVQTRQRPIQGQETRTEARQ